MQLMVLDAVRARPELAREEQACHMLIIMNDDSNESLLLLEASKYLLRHLLFASTFVYKTISSTYE